MASLLALFGLFFPIALARGPCDPLVPEYCTLPMPNSFYSIQDNSTPTGQQIHFPPKSLPVDILGRDLQPNEWNTYDGFSPFPSIVTYFDNLDGSNLPPHWDIAQSLSSNSPTILYNLQTGNTVPHFAELDVSFSISNRKALMIWPAVRLNDSSEYLVAIKNLKHTNGSSVLPSKAFRALRDGIATTDPNVEYRRAVYTGYFNALITSGIVKYRQDLQLLWHFNIASKECITKRLLYMRNDGAARVGSVGPPYSISKTIDNYSSDTYRHITGVMTVPLYLNSPLPGSHLVINDRGLPIYQADAVATFTVLVPQSVANGSIPPLGFVQYGHGLFSTQDEVTNGYLQQQANRYGYILASCDLWGMSEEDVPFIAEMLASNVSNFRIIPDRLSQGLLNELLLMKLLKGSLYKDPVLTFNGKISINPSESFYYGVSLGGIFGHVYMALSTDVERGVLGVPGGPIGLIFPRSSDFKPFEDGLRLLYPDTVDFVTILSLMNMLGSRSGPGGYMNSISGSLLPDTPPHRVIYQYGLGDAQVNILALYSSARSNNAKMFVSNVQETFKNGDVVVTEKLYGFQFVPDDAMVTDGSLAIGYDCHAPPEPMGNVPPNGTTDTHELPRRTLSAQEQMYVFFKSGVISNTCNGPCTEQCHI